jgi:hypothetical protein
MICKKKKKTFLIKKKIFSWKDKHNSALNIFLAFINSIYSYEGIVVIFIFLNSYLNLMK